VDDIIIRAAQDHELADAAELRWQWILENEETPATSKDEFVAFFVDWGRQQSVAHHCTVVLRGGVVIGMAWLAVVPRVPSPRSLVRASGDIQCVYVTPAERNSGIGTRLLRAVLQQAHDLSLERVVVHSSQAAITAYTRAGFEVSPRLLQTEPASAVADAAPVRAGN
jgi:GNAT superfamily N-acetyltransferase